VRKSIIPLHAHTHYSTKDAICSPADYVKRAVEFGLPAVAVTDHGNLNGFGNLYLESKKVGIKPIYGVEFYSVPSLEDWRKQYVAVGEKPDKETKTKLRNRNHLIVWAKTKIGFENLCGLIHESHLKENMYYKPRIDHAMLEKHREGLMVSSACLGGEIPQALIGDDIDGAVKSADWFKQVFGEDFYFEVQFNEIPDQAKVNKYLFGMGKNMGIKLIATGDSHFLDREHEHAHKSMLLIGAKETWDGYHKDEGWVCHSHAKDLFYKNFDQTFESASRYMDMKVSQFEGLAVNTFEVADKVVNFDFDTEVKIKDVVPDIQDKDNYLAKMVGKGMDDMGREFGDEYYKRVAFELSVIKEKGLAKYFLIIEDIVKKAKKKMFVGCGRGSGAGSLVNYFLGITEIDPIRWDLYFERFLAIDRADMPDIDLDFEDNDQIKRDLIRRFGDEIAYISSYDTFRLYGMIKDLGRIYGVESPSGLNFLNKKIRVDLDGADMSLGVAIKKSPVLKKFLTKHKKVYADMRVLSGKIRHVGKHAAGVVICDDLIKTQPINRISDVPQTSLTEGVNERTLPEFGYIKIDVLGLTTLKVIRETLDLIGTEDVKEKIHPDNIDLHDQKVYKHVFMDRNLVGVFQFETDAIWGMIDKVKPDCFEDLYAINALFRPGPLQGGIAFQYGDRKRGKSSIDYYGSEIVEKILKPTYGILIFQEQCMELCSQLGKISLSESNRIRKIFSKKLVSKKMVQVDAKAKEYLDDKRREFISGAETTGMDPGVALKLWNLMEKFSEYGFNKSHSVAYSMIAFQCCWLKTYYPIEFYTALFNSEKVENYARVLAETNKNNIKVLPLNLNFSKSSFSIQANKIVWGFSNIVGIGGRVGDEIVRVRGDNRAIKDWDIFLDLPFDWSIINRNAIETFLMLGCFRVKGNGSARAMVEAYKTYNRGKGSDQILMDVGSKWWGHYEKYRGSKWEVPLTDLDRSLAEIKAYRVNLKYSPFRIRVGKINRAEVVKKVLTKKLIGSFADRRTYVLATSETLTEKRDRRSGLMAFVTLRDFLGETMKGVIFSSVYDRSLMSGKVYVFKGYVDDNSFMVESYKDIDTIS